MRFVLYFSLTCSSVTPRLLEDLYMYPSTDLIENPKTNCSRLTSYSDVPKGTLIGTSNLILVTSVSVEPHAPTPLPIKG